MNLIVYDKPPGTCAERFQVRKIAFPVRAPGEDLVGGQRHRPGVFPLAGILGDIGGPKSRLVQEFAPPLPNRGQAGGEYERGLPDQFHRGQTDYGLAGAAGQNHHAAPAALGSRQVEGVGRLPLVVANPELRAFPKLDPKRLSGRVSCQVLGGETCRRQRLLQHATLARIDAESCVVDAKGQVPSRFAVARQAFRGCSVGARTE